MDSDARGGWLGQLILTVRRQSEMGTSCTNLWLMAAVISLTACNRQAEFVAPHDARIAVAVAKAYAQTNGWKWSILKDAKLQDGVWTIELASRSNPDYVSVQVSPDGKVTWYAAPR